MENRIKALRLARGYTEKQLADLLKISVRTLQRYQSGGDIPSSILRNMAAVFGVSTDEILLLEGNHDA